MTIDSPGFSQATSTKSATRHSGINRRFLLILLAVVLVLGVFFRCYNLERKLYWHDEVYTSIRTAGYDGSEVVKEAFTGTEIEVRDLMQFQSVDNGKTWQDSWQKLVDHPEHPPLYYVLSRAWQQLFGSSIASARSLSVFFSLLLFPVVFWLCRELFEEPTPGWWAMGLLAISPVQVLYAQEAREYSLLLLTTALSCVTLVAAVKKQKWSWWIFYAVATALNLYVSLLGGYVAIAQGVYILLLEKFRPNKVTIRYSFSGVLALVLFAPWLWNMYTQWNVLKAKTSWTNMTRPFIELLRYWELHLNSVFIDFYPSVSGYISVRVIGFVLAFVLVCYYLVCRQTKPHTSLLLVCVAIVPAIMLILPDVIDGGIKSIMTRYFLPSLLMVQVAVAYWLAQWGSRKDLKRSIALGLIVSCGIISCAMSAHSNHWWNKVVGGGNIQIAEIINSYQEPLVITNTIITSGNPDVNAGDFIALSHLLEDKVKLVLFKDEETPLVNHSQYSDVLLWNVEESIREQFAQQNNCDLKLVEGDYYPHIWEVTKNS